MWNVKANIDTSNNSGSYDQVKVTQTKLEQLIGKARNQETTENIHI